MNPAKPNNYGITSAGYVTDMSDADDLRTQLNKAGVTYQETSLSMGTLFADPASIITYTSPKLNRPVSVLIIPLVGPDSWCEEYYAMVGTDHEAALSRNWSAIVDEVRKLYQPDPRAVSSYMSQLGSITSDAKAAAARANGKRGGRPRKTE